MTLTATGPDSGTARVDDGPQIAFDHFGPQRGGSINLYGLEGDDTFQVTQIGNWEIPVVNVFGGDPTGSDHLIVNGTTGLDTAVIRPADGDSGSVAITGMPTVNFDTIESVTYDGQGGNDRLTVETPALTDVITLRPGVTRDAGTLNIDHISPSRALVAIAFEDLGGNGRLTLSDVGGGRADVLYYRGTDADDSFRADGANSGQIRLNDQMRSHHAGHHSVGPRRAWRQRFFRFVRHPSGTAALGNRDLRWRRHRFRFGPGRQRGRVDPLSRRRVDRACDRRGDPDRRDRGHRVPRCHGLRHRNHDRRDQSRRDL